jgi:hypothetical protein
MPEKMQTKQNLKYLFENILAENCIIWDTAQWVKIKKKMDKLITFFLMHFFSNPIQGKGKITQGIRF